MTNYPGFGVMRSQEHVDLLKNNFNNKIEVIKLIKDDLFLKTENSPPIRIYDASQSCCENRYMICDDYSDEFVGSTLIDVKLEGAPSIECEYGDHEVQFLKLVTDRGIITVSNHNEHDGYYGGFYIDWETVKEIEANEN